MTSPAPFGRMLTAMATAFTDDGSVDLDGTAAHRDPPRRPRPRRRRRQRHDGGVARPPPCAEDGEILRAVKDAVGDRATVVAGVGTNRTAHCVELAQQAEKLGADALLLVTPYYNKPGPGRRPPPLPPGGRGVGGLPVMLVRRPRTHRHPDRRRDLRGRQAATPSSRSRTPSATTPEASSCCELGYAVYSGDDARQPRLARPRCVRRDHRGRPRRRRPDPRDDRGLPRRRHRRCPQDLHDAAARDRRGDGRPQLRRHHRQGSPPAARRPRQPHRPRAARPPDDDEVAALRVGLEASHLL